MKMPLRRGLALLLCLALCLALVPAVSAEENPGVNADYRTMDVTYAGDSCIGTLTANMLEQDQSLEPSSGTVSEVLVTGTTAEVRYTADRRARLVVAIYPEEGIRMLGSGSVTVEAGEGTVYVTIDIDTMPQYFVTGTYLLDAETLEPLSDEYISRYYTRDFQDFLDYTTADYDQDLVVNLDDDPSTNYLVYGADVVRVREQNGANVLTKNGDGSYTITNAENRVRALDAGGKLAHTAADGNLTVVVIASIRVNGTTVTFTADENASLADVFDYVRIDTSSSTGGAYMDTEGLDEHVTFLGVSDAGERNAVMFQGTEGYGGAAGSIEIVRSKTWSYKIELPLAEGEIVRPGSSSNYYLGVEGQLDFTAAAKLKLYVCKQKDHKEFYTSLQLDTRMHIMANINASFEHTIGIGRPCLLLGTTGLMISFPISVEISAEAKMEVNGDLRATIGYAYGSESGKQNLTSAPVFTSSSELTGSLYFGIILEAQLSTALNLVLGDVASTSIRSSLGVLIEAQQKGYRFEGEDNVKRHQCMDCVEGKVTLVSKTEAVIHFVNTFTYELMNNQFPVGDFYYSFDRKEFGWDQTCPHFVYRTKVNVQTKSGETVEHAIVSVGDECVITDAAGAGYTYLPEGNYNVVASVEAYNGETALEKEEEYSEVTVVVPEKPPIPPSGSIGYVYDENSDTLTIFGQGTLPRMEYYYYDKDGTQKTVIFSNTVVIIKPGITAIGDEAFGYGLRSVFIPNTVRYIGTKAFSSSTLTSVTIPGSVVDIGEWAFSDNYYLSSLIISDGVKNIGKGAFSSCHSLQSVTIPGSVISIGEDAFYYCENLRSVTIHEGVVNIGDSAFMQCGALESVMIPDSVVNIDTGAFMFCGNLTTVTGCRGVKSIGESAFKGCYSLDMKIPEGVRSIGDEAFSGCAMTEAHIPNGVERLGVWTFSGCKYLTSVVIPPSLRDIDNIAFFACPGLKSLGPADSDCNIKLGWKSGEMNLPLQRFIALETVIIPDGITSIASSAFSSTTTLKSVTIPNSVGEIPGGAFHDCSALEEVYIPLSVTKIGTGAFANCTALRDVYYPGSANQWTKITVGEDNSALLGATVHFSANPAANTAALLAAGGADAPVVELCSAFAASGMTEGDEQGATFSGLAPGERYVVLVVADSGGDLLDSNNLLYIAQLPADEAGNLSLLYAPRRDSGYKTALAFGASPKKIADAEVSFEQRVHGITIPHVSYRGTALTEGTDYTCAVAASDNTVTVTLRGIGDYSGTAIYSAPKLPHTPGSPVYENEIPATPYEPGTCDEVVYCSACHEELSRTQIVSADWHILYDANGGTGAPAAQGKLTDKPVRLSNAIPTRPGWSFIGWAKSAAAKVPDYLPGDAYMENEDLTLYALWIKPDFILPRSLQRVEEEAFAGGSFTYVVLPAGTVSVGQRAFAGCAELRYIYIPEDCVIDPDAFYGTAELTVFGAPGGSAETFAREHGFTFRAAG